jgi:uncharacterized protein
MGSARSDRALADGPRGTDVITPVKVVVAGGFGVGKTTLVSSISEIRPLLTEATMTQASIGVDDVSGVSSKTTTTVAMDFGRITMANRLILYLFGTPGQDRFPAVDYFEQREVPFIVAINVFDGSPRHDAGDVRVALDLEPRIPLVLCDARQRASVKQVLITLVEYVLTRPSSPAGDGQEPANDGGGSGQDGGQRPTRGARGRR